MIDLNLIGRLAAAISLGALLATPAYAQRLDGAGGGRVERAEQHGQQGRGQAQPPARGGPQGNRGGNRDEQRAQRDGRADAPAISVHFTDRHRTQARSYYADQIRAGHCPPGLAKKRNGCMPPGLAKRWRLGQPLGRDVSFYDPPSAIIRAFGAPPRNHRYVRVDNDLLLIEIGTRLVIDAIEGLGNM
ncbi:hypothetical protein ACKVEX_09745 [Rhodocyclaceae bacterium SMB388]